jgi:hypothetical protein
MKKQSYGDAAVKINLLESRPKSVPLADANDAPEAAIQL